MQPLCGSGGCCPGGRGYRGGRGGCSRGRGNSGKRGARGGNGGWDDQGFSQSSANFGNSCPQHPGGSDQRDYPKYGTPNFNGGASGSNAGSGQEYSGAAGYEGHSAAGFAGSGYSPNPGAVGEPYCQGFDYSGHNRVGRGGVGSKYVGNPSLHGAARRGQGFNGKFRYGRNGDSDQQDSTGARSSDAGVRGQRGAGRQRRGVGNRGYGGPSSRGRSILPHRSDTTGNSDVGDSNTERNNGLSKQQPGSNRGNDKGEGKKNSKNADIREKKNSKPKNPGDEEDKRSRKQKSAISNSKARRRRKGKAVSSGVGTTSSTASVYYEWQFKEVKGSWIRYGSPNTGGDFSCVTTTSSDDIEKYFSSDPDKTPLLIKSNSHQYILDFQKMTQTNQDTLVQSQIRRVLRRAVKPTPINIQYEWHFQDEHGTWVRYGSPNTVGDLSCVTTTSSDDIEKHYSSDPMKKALLIRSNRHQYLLDFQAMTQTNQVTSVPRSIRRVATHPGKRIATKNPELKHFGVGASNSHYVWQFQDEHGGWIRYGSPNSGGDLSCVTKITSDDIEKHYSTRPKSSLTTQSNSHRYLLDFKSMTQINQTTMTRRPIRRVLTQPSQKSQTQQVLSSFRPYFNGQSAVINGRQSTVAYEWFFLDESNSWIPYGQPNSLNKMDCVTSVSSDDIEKHYQQNPNQSIDIASQKHMYRLDFVNMTQTNKQTLVVRSISRKPSTRIQSGRLNSHSSSNSDSLPSNWASMALSSSAWTAVPLNTSDLEYIKHVGIIKQSVPTFTVRQMYRVQNPFIWKAYVNKKDYMNKQNPGIQFREEYLYHGTDPKNVKAICEENIDWRLHGTSNGQTHGRGAYFSKRPQLATHYSGQQGVVFIVKVLVGRTTTGSADTVKPPKDLSGKPYDTTVDNETNPSIFVKYDTQEYYPEYYVEF